MKKYLVPLIPYRFSAHSLIVTNFVALFQYLEELSELGAF